MWMVSGEVRSADRQVPVTVARRFLHAQEQHLRAKLRDAGGGRGAAATEPIAALLVPGAKQVRELTPAEAGGCGTRASPGSR
jgi:hypothetical protein